MKTVKMQDVLTATAVSVMAQNKQADYDADKCSDIEKAARNIIDFLDMESGHLNDMLVYRVTVEQHLAKRYKTKFSDNPLSNTESMLKRKRVPQLKRIEHGILDMIIGELYVRSQAPVTVELTF